jgi:hypothetical protein
LKRSGLRESERERKTSKTSLYRGACKRKNRMKIDPEQLSITRREKEKERKKKGERRKLYSWWWSEL